MFCRYCGNELPDDAQFCNACGKSVDTGQQEALSKPSQTETSSLEHVNKSRKINPVKVISIFLILCSIVTIFVTIGGKTHDNKGDERNSVESNVVKDTTVPTESVTTTDAVRTEPEKTAEPEQITPEPVTTADPEDPSTWIYCTGEEEWYEDAMIYGEDFNYDEWLEYREYMDYRLENNYDDEGNLIYPDEDEDEYFNSDDPTNYDARQYYGNVGLTGPYWEQENPYGYFKHGYFNLDNLFGMYASQTAQFEFDSGLSIDYLKETNEIEFKYYLSYSKMRPETEPDMQFRMDADDVIGKNSWSFVPNDEEKIDFEIVYLDENSLYLTYDPNFNALCIRVHHEGPYSGKHFMFDGSFYIQYFYHY